MTSTNVIATNSLGASKLVVAFIAMVMTVLVVMTGAAGATGMPDSKADCKSGGYKSLVNDEGKKFKNQGECVKFAVANANGGGYGGGTTNHNNVNNAPNIVLDIRNAANNVINVTVNYVTNIFN